MTVLLLRHSLTEGNLHKRYIGRTDEPLCTAGIQRIGELRLPPEYRNAPLYSSPMQRCLQTARLLFDREPAPVEDFRECDFGLFENRNHAELDGDPRYQSWVDSNGALPFPGGESKEGFSARCCTAFEGLLRGTKEEHLAVIVHGGTIMAVMERFARPERAFYEWWVDNGCGYICQASIGETLTLLPERKLEI